MRNFLIAKHWQIFLLVAGMPIISDLFFDKTNSNEFSFNSMITIISCIFFFAWLWSIESVIGRLVIKINPIRSRQFRFIYFTVTLYIAISLMLLFFTGMFLDNIYWLIIHFICIIFLLAIFYQCAKLIKHVELTREPQFSEVFTYFVFIWFFPIGIWVIQPKLNKIIKDIRQEN